MIRIIWLLLIITMQVDAMEEIPGDFSDEKSEEWWSQIIQQALFEVESPPVITQFSVPENNSPQDRSSKRKALEERDLQDNNSVQKNVIDNEKTSISQIAIGAKNKKVKSTSQVQCEGCSHFFSGNAGMAVHLSKSSCGMRCHKCQKCFPKNGSHECKQKWSDIVNINANYTPLQKKQLDTANTNLSLGKKKELPIEFGLKLRTEAYKQNPAVDFINRSSCPICNTNFWNKSGVRKHLSRTECGKQIKFGS